MHYRGKSRHLNVVGSRVDVLRCVNHCVVMPSRDCASDARKNVRGNLVGQSERMVCIAGHDGAPRWVFTEDGQQLRAVRL